jgi:hypothetical protein
MRFHKKLSFAVLIAAGMLVGSQARGFDDPGVEGIVRITDAQNSSQPVADPGASSYNSDYPNGYVSGSPNDPAGYGYGECYGGEYCDDGTGCCLCDYCFLNGCWHCNKGCCLPEYKWPDYGYARIVKYPIHRMPVQYYRYWPQRWWGEPGSGIAANAPRFPVIYTPTDTTELGVYYQRVPQWLPNPAMLPPAPWPTDWHRRECPSGNGQCGPQGAVTQTSGTAPTPATSPTPTTTTPQEPAPEVAPPPPEDAPPAPKTTWRGPYQRY